MANHDIPQPCPPEGIRRLIDAALPTPVRRTKMMTLGQHAPARGR
jgi:hypothetical protein